VRAVLREGSPVKGDVFGLDCRCAHGTPPCGHYERGGEDRQLPENGRAGSGTPCWDAGQLIEQLWRSILFLVGGGDSLCCKQAFGRFLCQPIL
jgi:hypothetical protein